MNCWTRRQFGCLAGAACLTALAPRVARGQAKSRVVVIGGGIGGATVARYLAASAGNDRGDAGRAQAALYDLLLQRPLSRRHALVRIAHAWL